MVAHHAVAAAALKRLENARRIERRNEEEDGRVRTVVPTPAGRPLVNSAAKARLESAQDTAFLLPARERKVPVTHLRELLLAMESG